ncbi:MAG: hypothetical protein IJU76_06390, partial [Desulfovibrionaceae bacterium]|nr:hypothetical protein [Desulfovibrionaceae bacterium]
FGLMFHGFDYPDETGKGRFGARFWHPTMRHGIITYPQPNDLTLLYKDIRAMKAKSFHMGTNCIGCDEEGFKNLIEEPNSVAYPNAHDLLRQG